MCGACISECPHTPSPCIGKDGDGFKRLPLPRLDTMHLSSPTLPFLHRLTSYRWQLSCSEIKKSAVMLAWAALLWQTMEAGLDKLKR